MLTDEEKRKIEEKVQYEEAYRQKLNNKPGPVHHENEYKTESKNINNPYAKILSRSEIENNIVPGLIKIYEYLDHCDQLEEIYLNETEKLNKMEYKSKNIDKHTRMGIILGFIGFIYTLLHDAINIKAGLFTRFIMFLWGLPYDFINNMVERSNSFFALVLAIVWIAYYLAVPIIVVMIIIKFISLIYCKFIRSKILKKKIPAQKEIVNQRNIEFIEYVDKNMYMVKDIPEKYRTVGCIEKFIDYFKNFRVKSFQEAFNMLEEEENPKTKNEINIFFTGE